MLGLAAVPSIIMFFGCLILPESPRWLVSKGYDDEAFKVLKKLRGSADVSSELRAMQEVCEETASAENSNYFIYFNFFMFLYCSRERKCYVHANWTMMKQDTNFLLP